MKKKNNYCCSQFYNLVKTYLILRLHLSLRKRAIFEASSLYYIGILFGNLFFTGKANSIFWMIDFDVLKEHDF